MESSFEKVAVLLSKIEVTTELRGCKTPVFKKNPGPEKLAIEMDSPILHSMLGAEPPPLLKVNGVIDCAASCEKQKNIEIKDKKNTNLGEQFID